MKKHLDGVVNIIFLRKLNRLSLLPHFFQSLLHSLPSSFYHQAFKEIALHQDNKWLPHNKSLWMPLSLLFSLLCFMFFFNIINHSPLWIISSLDFLNYTYLLLAPILLLNPVSFLGLPPLSYPFSVSVASNLPLAFGCSLLGLRKLKD